MTILLSTTVLQGVNNTSHLSILLCIHLTTANCFRNYYDTSVQATYTMSRTVQKWVGSQLGIADVADQRTDDRPPPSFLMTDHDQEMTSRLCFSLLER